MLLCASACARCRDLQALRDAALHACAQYVQCEGPGTLFLPLGPDHIVVSLPRKSLVV